MKWWFFFVDLFPATWLCVVVAGIAAHDSELGKNALCQVPRTHSERSHPRRRYLTGRGAGDFEMEQVNPFLLGPDNLNLIGSAPGNRWRVAIRHSEFAAESLGSAAKTLPSLLLPPPLLGFHPIVLISCMAGFKGITLDSYRRVAASTIWVLSLDSGIVRPST